MSEDRKKVSAEAAEAPAPRKSHAGNGSRTGSSRSSGKGARSSNKGVITGALSAVVILAAGGGAVAAASMMPEPSGGTTLDIRQADVPAGRALGVCPEPARLVNLLFLQTHCFKSTKLLFDNIYNSTKPLSLIQNYIWHRYCIFTTETLIGG